MILVKQRDGQRGLNNKTQCYFITFNWNHDELLLPKPNHSQGSGCEPQSAVSMSDHLPTLHSVQKQCFFHWRKTLWMNINLTAITFPAKLIWQNKLVVYKSNFEEAGWGDRWFHQAGLTDTESDKVTEYRGHQILWGWYFWPRLHWEQTFQGHKTERSSRLRWDLAVLYEGYLREGIWKQWETLFWLCWEGDDILRAGCRITWGQKKNILVKELRWRRRSSDDHTVCSKEHEDKAVLVRLGDYEKVCNSKWHNKDEDNESAPFCRFLKAGDTLAF